MASIRTEYFVADIVLPDEVSQQLLVHTSLIHNRSVPERTPKFNRFEQNRLSLFQTQVAAETEAEAHGAEAWRRHRDVLKWKCVDHFDLLELWSKSQKLCECAILEESCEHVEGKVNYIWKPYIYIRVY